MNTSTLWTIPAEAPETMRECLSEARELKQRLASCKFNWLTGQFYRALLQWKIDTLNGKDTRKPTTGYWQYIELDPEIWGVRNINLGGYLGC